MDGSSLLEQSFRWLLGFIHQTRLSRSSSISSWRFEHHMLIFLVLSMFAVFVNSSTSDSDLFEQVFSAIDVDGDQIIKFDELSSFMLTQYNKSYEAQLHKQFAAFDKNQNSFVSWDEYFTSTFAVTKDGQLDHTKYAPKHLQPVVKSIATDRKRFEWLVRHNYQSIKSKENDQTDNDGDGDYLKLDYHSLRMFLIPELYPIMHPFIIESTMLDLDVNQDGVVSVDEYISALLKSHRPTSEDDQYNKEDLTREYEYFFSHRDANKDGFMEYDEIVSWIIPPHRKQPVGTQEARELFEKCDQNSDKTINKNEILSANLDNDADGELVSEEKNMRFFIAHAAPWINLKRHEQVTEPHNHNMQFEDEQFNEPPYNGHIEL